MAIFWQSTPVVSSSYSGWEYKLGLEVTTTDISDTQTKVVADVWFWSKWALDSANYNLYFNFDATEATTLISNRAEIHVGSSSSWDTANQIKLATFEKIYTRDSSDHIFDCAVKTTQVAGFKNETGNYTLAYTIPAENVVVETYTIYLKSTKGIASVSGGGDYPAGTKITLSAVVANGYSWAGWSDGNIDNPREFIVNGYYEITAQAKPNTHYVYYDANGGTGAPDTQSFLYGSYDPISEQVPTRKGYEFRNWYCPEDDSLFNPGEWIPSHWDFDFTLIAQWTKLKSSGLVYIDNGTQFEAYQMFIDNGTNWDQVIPYMDNGTEWSSLL